MGKVKRFFMLFMVMIGVLSVKPVYAKTITVDSGVTENGDYVVGSDLQEFSGRVVSKNMYIGDNGKYTFYGNLTVNGDLYILGTFYNHGSLKVYGNIYCRNYYNHGILEKRASQMVDGQLVYYSKGEFYNNGSINKDVLVGSLLDIKVPSVDIDGCFIGQHEPGPAATCTTPQVCAKCGEILTPALGHKPGPSATCTKPQTCTVCGTVLDRNGSHVAGKEATCTEPQKCIECGAILSPALGHNPGKEATCKNPQTCMKCGEILVPALNHKWDTWYIRVDQEEPTVFSGSVEVRYCLTCGKEETRTVSKLTPTGYSNYNNVVLQKGKSTSAVKITGMSNGDYLKSVVPQNKKLVKISSVKQSGNFKITALKKTGKTVLTATLASGHKININITVQSKAVKTSKLYVNKSVVTLAKGRSFTLKVNRDPFNASDVIKYSSSNKKIATVNSKGKIVAKKKGTAYITVKAGNVKKKVKVIVSR